MKSKSRYSPKKLKFSGEESFMVPKEGEKFVLAAGADTIAIDKQNIENVDTAPLEPVSVTNPNVVVADSQVTTPPSVVIPVPDWANMDCVSIQNELNNLQELMTVSRFTPEVYAQYQNIIASGQSAYNSKCLNQIEPPPPPDDVPPAPQTITEPNWSSLTCEQVMSELTSLKSFYDLGLRQIGKENYTNIPTYIQNGKKYYVDNCENKQIITAEKDVITTPTGGGVGAPPITTITTTGTPIIATASTGGLGGAIGGVRGSGGASGGGAAQEQKKGFNWWWLLLIAGGAYLLTRKN